MVVAECLPEKPLEAAAESSKIAIASRIVFGLHRFATGIGCDPAIQAAGGGVSVGELAGVVATCEATAHDTWVRIAVLKSALRERREISLPSFAMVRRAD